MNQQRRSSWQNPAHPPPQVFRIDRLDQPAGHALAVLRVELTGLSAGQDQRPARIDAWAGRGRPPQATNRRGSASPGRSAAGRTAIPARPEARFAVGDRDDLEVHVAELLGHPAPHRGAVIGVQDGLAHGMTQPLNNRTELSQPDNPDRSATLGNTTGGMLTKRTSRLRSRRADSRRRSEAGDRPGPMVPNRSNRSEAASLPPERCARSRGPPRPRRA